MSHPLRVRELKQARRRRRTTSRRSHPLRVRELKRALTGHKSVGMTSHPLRVRELKLPEVKFFGDISSRTLYGCVN